MGYYISPRTQTKEEWLVDNATIVTDRVSIDTVPEGYCLLCHVNNGAFTALGVVNSERELSAWLQPGDHRPKDFYLAKKEVATEASGMSMESFKY